MRDLGLNTLYQGLNLEIQQSFNKVSITRLLFSVHL